MPIDIQQFKIPSLLQNKPTSFLFVGINPSANEKDETRIGHYFAGSRNRFFSCLNESGNEQIKNKF